MNARDFITLCGGGKRIGKGKYVCRCSAHPDKTPSLIVREGDRGLLLKCWSHHCSAEAICNSIGIKVSDLFFDSDNSKIRPMLYDRKVLAALEYRHGWLIVGKAVEGEEKYRYYDKAIEGIEKDIKTLRKKLYPDEAILRQREERFQKIDLSQLWSKLLPRFEEWELKQATARQLITLENQTALQAKPQSYFTSDSLNWTGIRM